jgi:hypothetical protein
MYFTGEMRPTTTPQRYYACVNKHIVLVYGDATDPDWGDKSIAKAWREALISGDHYNYKMIGTVRVDRAPSLKAGEHVLTPNEIRRRKGMEER